VAISRREVTRLIGTVFLQRSAVTLLVPVLDTPEFFWSAPDKLQVRGGRAGGGGGGGSCGGGRGQRWWGQARHGGAQCARQ
jgi:hypothetical protein